jgi:hypothetical protein
MTTMIVRYRVRDYFDWQRVFNYSTGARRAYGITNERVFRETRDGNSLVIVAEVSSAAKAKAFFASSLCKKIDEKADVIGQAAVSFPDEEPRPDVAA